jgi:hypothetical protein
MPGQSKTLEDLFEETLKDIYYAERKILVALPKMAKAVNSNGLKAAFEKHIAETEGQVDRIQRVFKMLKKPAKGKTCPAILAWSRKPTRSWKTSRIPQRSMRVCFPARRPWSIMKSPAMAPLSIGRTSWA